MAGKEQAPLLISVEWFGGAFRVYRAASRGQNPFHPLTI
ncbi:hypothetical protein OH687_29605 [Burkholderia anthina]|nr:hypothetical protein OH687_29605 [Burkholderia anthina]